MTRELQRLTWTRIKHLVPDKIQTALLPIGTVEAHGAAAVGTDNIIPETIAAMEAERVNALIAPTLNYGITTSLYQYPGSIRIDPKHFAPFVLDILTSLADTGFSHVFVLNGHGGNNASLREAAYAAHRDRRIGVAVIHWWQLVAELTREYFGEAGGHGGIDETACMQAIDPDLVDKAEYSEEMAYLVNPGADVYPAAGSVLLYKGGEGHPNFDEKQAADYLPKVAHTVGDFVLSTIARWKQIER
jgi:creatinine amidohydrolase